MRLRVVRSICLPRQVMIERGFFVTWGARLLQGVSRFVPACPGMDRSYLAYSLGFISSLNSKDRTVGYNPIGSFRE